MLRTLHEDARPSGIDRLPTGRWPKYVPTCSWVGRFNAAVTTRTTTSPSPATGSAASTS